MSAGDRATRLDVLLTLKSLENARARELKATRDVARFANYAREQRATWTEIGAALGISKQAAQQRYALDLDRPLPEQSAGGTRWTEPTIDELT